MLNLVSPKATKLNELTTTRKTNGSVVFAVSMITMKSDANQALKEVNDELYNNRLDNK